MSQWKEGDIASVQCSDMEWRPALCLENLHGLIWQFPRGAYRIVRDSYARPLVVIDPEDLFQVSVLANVMMAHGCRSETDLQSALREFAAPTPPKPAEPMGLGAVVEDAHGAIWVRAIEYAAEPWRSAGRAGKWSDYQSINDPTELSPGIATMTQETPA